MEKFVACVGWDWADDEHVLSVRESGSVKVEARRLGGAPEDLHGWAAEMLRRFGGENIAIAIDGGRGAVISAFINYPHLTLYPINPKSAASLRNAFYPSGRKDDPVDSEVLLEIVEKHRDRIRPLNPADPATRELGILSEHRRKLDDSRKREVNRLRAALKSYYPQAIAILDDLSTPMACAFLSKWPSLAHLQRAKDATIAAFFREHRCRSNKRIEERIALIRSAVPLTTDVALVHSGSIRVTSLASLISEYLRQMASVEREIATLYAEHPLHDLVDSFPGLGAVLGPRVIAILGTDGSRFESAESLQQFSGVAPITRQTGGKHGPKSVQRRHRRPRFIHQTLIEWAGCSILFSPWAKAYYELKREQHPTASHWSILRRLAYKWVRVLFRCWIENIPYDEAKYQEELILHGSPIAKRLPEAA
jgi:transposase